MFCCSWTTYLEQLTRQSARQGSKLHRIQKTTENIHVSDGLRRIVTFLIIAPYKYSYLLTYLLRLKNYDSSVVCRYPHSTQSRFSLNSTIKQPYYKSGRHQGWPVFFFWGGGQRQTHGNIRRKRLCPHQRPTVHAGSPRAVAINIKKSGVI